MKLGKRFSMTIGALALAVAGSAQAANVTYVTDATTTSVIPGLATYATTGATMSGLSVVATFVGGLTETLAWAAGGVSGNGWSLSVAGDTYTSNWNFDFTSNVSAPSLLSLQLSGASGYTLFDRYYNGFDGTVGSEKGTDLKFVDPAIVATVTYSNRVRLTGLAPVGDLWNNVTINFGNGISNDFSFTQDTDNDIRYRVPEPGALSLLGLALAGVGFSARRRKAA